MKDSKLYNFNWVAWFVSIVSGLLILLTEVIDFGANTSNIFMISEISVGFAIFIVFVLSVYNFLIAPPNRIFITYEKFLRLSLEEYFKELN